MFYDAVQLIRSPPAHPPRGCVPALFPKSNRSPPITLNSISAQFRRLRYPGQARDRVHSGHRARTETARGFFSSSSTNQRVHPSRLLVSSNGSSSNCGAALAQFFERFAPTAASASRNRCCAVR